MKYFKSSMSVFLILSAACIIGCASTAPLPETLNIVPPSPDVPPEIAAFSGVWEGKWNGTLDTVLVVEKIKAEQAEIIISISTTPGFEGRYFYAASKILPEPAIEWTDPEGNKFVYKMENGKVKAYVEEKATGAKRWAYMTRRK